MALMLQSLRLNLSETYVVVSGCPFEANLEGVDAGCHLAQLLENVLLSL